MSVCVLVPCDGSPARRVVWDQATISAQLGGSVTFVGMKDDLIAVGLLHTKDDAPSCKVPSDLIFPNTQPRGDAVIIAVDEDGDPIDVDIDRVGIPVSCSDTGEHTS